MGKMNEITKWLKQYLRYRIGIRRLDRKARKKDKIEGGCIHDIVNYCDIMANIIYLIDLSVEDFKNKDLKASTEALGWVNWYIPLASKLLDK